MPVLTLRLRFARLPPAIGDTSYMSAMRRVSVLLGAGASRDAGLPLTSELAAGVLQRLTSETPSTGRRPDWLVALNFVYGAMVSYRSRDGGNALDAVNIETLISALRLLGRREDHEAAPFVESWRDPVLRAGQLQVDENSARRLTDALSAVTAPSDDRFRARRGSRPNDGLNLAYAVAAIADLARTPTRLSSYRDANTWVTRTLGKLLLPSKPVTYLHPLADLAKRQAGGLDVITLNYDLTIETAMAEKSLAVNRGIENWPSRRVFYSPDAPVRLHKVHGSLDWAMEIDPHRQVPVMKDLHGEIAQQPWVVVGDREKLATEGPTLELMQHAADALERSDHLVIAGYGFGDDHINHMIRNWLERDSTRSVGLIEPQWSYPDDRSFRGRLGRLYGEQWDHADQSRRATRVQGFPGTAAEMLGVALARPEVDTSLAVDIEVMDQKPSGWDLDVTVRLTGTPLWRVGFSADQARCEIHAEAGRVETIYGATQYLDRWEAGEQIRITIRTGSLPRTGWQLHVEGHDLVSTIRRSLMLADLEITREP
ncbi:SIR2-like domain-containing protein [Microbacterium sp. RU1D]|nr:hypothetical protein DBR36_07330 [Microbacterium sp. HMWF026]SIT93563.1 SIR2-like domain-containing protein [Microbacterium sp. RU1D]